MPTLRQSDKAQRGTHASPYRPEIDGIRAIAVLAVLINHFNAGWLTGGFLGVDIFFVISGYVITGSLSRKLNEHTSKEQPSQLIGFYRRRVQRLIPALAVFLLITSVLCAVFIPEPRDFLQTAVAALFGFSNLELARQATDYFSESADLNPFTHTWSLAVEEQFYLVYPFVFFLSTSRRNPDTPGHGASFFPNLETILIITAVASLGLFWAVSADESAYYATLPRVWELIAGCLLFRFSKIPRPISRPPNRLTTSIAPWIWLLLLIAALAVRMDRTTETLLAVAATCGLISSLTAPSAIKNALLLPPLQHIGRISYSLYLWHWGFLALARWTISAKGFMLIPISVAILIAAECSYNWVENPWRYRTWMSGDLKPILAGVSINGTTAALITSLGLGSGHPWLFSGSRAFKPSNTLHLDHPQQPPTSSPDLSACMLSPKQPLSGARLEQLIHRCSPRPSRPQIGSQSEQATEPHHFFILGDSHAGALQPVAHDLVHRGYAVTLISREGCPFPAGQGHMLPLCERFQRQVEAHVIRMIKAGDTVVVADYLASHLADRKWPESRSGIKDASGRVIRSGEQKRRTFAETINRFAGRVAARGGRTLLLSATPRLLNRELCTPQWYRPASVREQCRRTQAEDQKRLMLMHNDLKRRIQNAELVDMQHHFCPTGCDLTTLGWLLFDTDHLSSDAALQLSTLLRARSIH
ncbi:MAG: acyltransferase family protein [Synechococcus sp.]